MSKTWIRIRFDGTLDSRKYDIISCETAATLIQYFRHFNSPSILHTISKKLGLTALGSPPPLLIQADVLINYLSCLGTGKCLLENDQGHRSQKHLDRQCHMHGRTAVVKQPAVFPSSSGHFIPTVSQRSHQKFRQNC